MSDQTSIVDRLDELIVVLDGAERYVGSDNTKTLAYITDAQDIAGEILTMVGGR